MKPKDIKSDDDILICIEGITNDFEEFLSTKVETNNAILELVLHVAEAAQEKLFTSKDMINYSIWRCERTIGDLKELIPNLFNDEQVLKYWIDNIKTKQQ